MPELNDDEIGALARAVDLDIQDSDMEDVKHSLNAMLEAMDKVNLKGINSVEPLPIIRAGE